MTGASAVRASVVVPSLVPAVVQVVVRGRGRAPDEPGAHVCAAAGR